MNEIWKDISGCEGVYQASDLGRVRVIAPRRGVKPGHILSTQQIGSFVYVRLRIEGKLKMCHLPRLILETFEPRRNSARLEVVYDNGRPDDNRLDNLVWCTHAEAQARRRFNYCRGEAVPSAKLTSEAVREIRRLYTLGFQQTDIAPNFGVSQCTVSRVVSGRAWRHVA